MRTRIVLISTILLLLAGCHAAPTPPSPPKDWTITMKWNFDFTNFAPCSPTVTKGCISNFTWGYLQGATQIPLKTSLVTACPGSTGVQSCTDTTNATVGIGTVVPYVIANGIDNSGTAVSASPSQGPADNVAIGAATAVSWTRQ